MVFLRWNIDGGLDKCILKFPKIWTSLQNLLSSLHKNGFLVGLLRFYMSYSGYLTLTLITAMRLWLWSRISRCSWGADFERPESKVQSSLKAFWKRFDFDFSLAVHDRSGNYCDCNFKHQILFEAVFASFCYLYKLIIVFLNKIHMQYINTRSAKKKKKKKWNKKKIEKKKII